MKVKSIIKTSIVILLFVLLIDAIASSFFQSISNNIHLEIDNQNFNKAKLDSLFIAIEDNRKGMGSISIFRDGDEIYQKSFGYADIDNKIKTTANTKYRIGSVSKSFTAVIIMKLIEEGKLSLTTKLSDFFPSLPNANEITIEQLLRHRSGLFDFTKSIDYVNWMTEPKTRTELLTIIKDNGPVFEPNKKTRYSNTNYVILTYIAEDIEGEEFSKIIEKHITKPLGLKNTYYGDKIHPENFEALSYDNLHPWKIAKETNSKLAMGAGAIVSNPSDINTFYYKLFKGDILSKASLDEMRMIVDNFGIGLMQTFFFDKKVLGHNGAIDGFQTRALYFPEDNISLAYMTNAVDMNVDDIVFGALSIYYGMNYTIPTFNTEMDSISTDLDQYLGIYVNPDFPLEITISRRDDSLIAQATGQPSFILEPFALHKYKYDPAGFTMEFIPAEKRMILRQYGGVIEFKIKN